MIKGFSNQTCVFDCEWVPCAATLRRLLALPADTSEAEVFKQGWAHFRKADDLERPFLKLVLNRVVSLAALFRDRGRDGRVKLQLCAAGIDTYDEGELISTFLERVGYGVPDQGYQLWGFNSRDSDLTLLEQRAVALDLSCPHFNNPVANRYAGIDYHDPYNGGHVDLMKLLGGYGKGATPSLHEMAAACAIPGKLGLTGEDVAPYYLQGRIAEIVAYNQLDVFTTHLLMLRVAHYAGRLTRADYDQEVAAFEELLTAETERGNVAAAQFDAAWVRYERPALDQDLPNQAAGPATFPSARPEELPHWWYEVVAEAKGSIGIQLQAALRAVRGLETCDTNLTLVVGPGQAFSRNLILKPDNLQRLCELIIAKRPDINGVTCRLA